MQAAEHEFGDDPVAGAIAIRCEYHRRARLVRLVCDRHVCVMIADGRGSNFSQADAGRPHCRMIPFVRNASPR